MNIKYWLLLLIFIVALWHIAYSQSIIFPGPGTPTSALNGVHFLNDPVITSLSGNTTIAFLGNPTSLTPTGNTTITFLGNPTGLGLTGNTTITFLGNPTGISVTNP